MLPISKLHQMVVPTTVAAASTTTGFVDTIGYDYAVVTLVGNTQVVSDIPTTLRLGQSDTAPTAFTDTTVITNFVGGTATSTSVGFVIPTPVTTTSSGVNDYSVKFNVDLKGRQRYLAVQYSPLSTDTFGIDCRLHRADVSPIGTTLANVLVDVSA